MLIFNGTEVHDVIFNDIIIETIVIDGIAVYSTKQAYVPTQISRIVSPYGETVQLQIEAPQDGGEYDIDNIQITGGVPITDLVLSAYDNALSFKTNVCNKGLTGNISIPVTGSKKYYDYNIPIILDSCTHPSNKLTYHSGSSASCTGSGVSAYYTCSCDAANHTLNSSGNEISTYIAPLGHNSSSSSTASSHLKSSATCTSPAYYYYSCSRCGTNSSSSFSYGSSLGHDFNTSGQIWSESRQLRSAATCTSAATYWCECRRCTVHSSTNYFSSGSSLGHDYVNYKCTRCGSTIGPTITSQPKSYQVSFGTSVNMSVSATGYNLSYTLYRRIIGKTGWAVLSTTQNNYGYVIYTDTQPEGVEYYFVIKDGYGNSVTSNTASILPK